MDFGVKHKQARFYGVVTDDAREVYVTPAKGTRHSALRALHKWAKANDALPGVNHARR